MESRKIKQWLLKSPEYYFALLVFLDGCMPSLAVKPIYLIMLIVLIVQIILKNQILGLIIASVFFLINLYFLLAFLSEFKKFTGFTENVINFLIFGIPLLALNFTAMGIMFYKYLSIADSR